MLKKVKIHKIGKMLKPGFLYFIFLLLFTACAPTNNIVYFSDLGNATGDGIKIAENVEPKIQPNDLLSITVSSLNPESNALFNAGVLQQTGSMMGGMMGAAAAAGSSSGNASAEGYLVDKDGTINFPVLGTIKLGGLSKAEATAKMTSEISKDVKKPIVNIRFLNFKVTVLGEVNRPSTFTVPTEKINILEALSLAGDITVYGKKENVLLIREKDGIRSTVRINMNKKAVLSSPYFYLQQNDIIYIEPDKAKSLQTDVNRTNTQFFITLGTSFVSILSLFIAAGVFR